MDDLNHSPHPVSPSRKRKSQPKEGSKRLYLTLNGFLIDLLRKTGPLRIDELNRKVKENIHRLRRIDGSNYKGDVYKILIGVLSNCTAFVEDLDGWRVVEENAKSYEESTVKNINRRLGKYRIKSCGDRKAGKLFQQRVNSCQSPQLHQLLLQSSTLLPPLRASVFDLATEVMSWKSGSEVLSGMNKERVAGMMYMMQLLQQHQVLSELQPESDLTDVKRKVAKLSAELNEVEQGLMSEEDLDSV